MARFTVAREELAEASAALGSLRRPRLDGDTINKSWISFLDALERCYFKIEAELKPVSRWQGRLERAALHNLRKDDPTLAYLRNARGQREHGLEPVAHRMNIMRILSPNEQAAEYIDRVQGIGGKPATFVSVHDIAAGRMPRILAVSQAAQLRLMPVTNRRKLYPVPTTHMGKQLPGIDPVSIGAAGIKFYAATINNLAGVFFPDD